MVNSSTEDYIKSIYRLEREDETVLTTSLAKHLGIGAGSVTDMIKKLSEKQLLHYEPYQGVKLTEDGKRLALKMVRRHRLWEMFLVTFLNYTWDEVHDEAERLEHVTSDELENRLDKALGFPKVDPHGDPIPTAEGELNEISFTSLSDCNINTEGIIVRVSDDSPEVLQLLTKLGLGLNTKLLITQKVKYDGSVIIKMKNREIPLSPVMARSIFIQVSE
ncbi:MAG: metal-dependent transcriptional regulator [Ignavibacteriae bacterium]|nr:metal-dependent transcriptional regulator [Ignavibacteriota bacterium]